MTWFGQAMFQVRDESVSLVTDPYGPDVGYIVPKVSADVLLLSDGGYDLKEDVRVGGQPRVVDSVGENYVGSFLVVGIPSRGGVSGKYTNTIYYWKMQGMGFAHMGESLKQKGLTPQQEGLLRNVEVLMMPVGGGTSLDARNAARIAQAINPKIVIPMDFKTDAAAADLAPVEVFSSRFASIKRIGDTVDIGPDDLPEQTEVWVMRYQQQRP